MTKKLLLPGMQKLLGLFFLLFSWSAQAQFGNNQIASGFDSTGVGRDSSRVQYTGFSTSEVITPNLRKIDLSLDKIQFYQPFYLQQSLVNTSLGNNGTACYPLVFSPETNLGFQTGFSAFNAYFLPAESTRFYDAQSPYTEAFYVQGAREEAFFHLKHTQNAGRKVNFGIEYRRINSQGYFLSQTAQHSAIRLHTWLRPGNARYQMMFAATYHKGSALENGGITAEGDSLYATGTENNRQIYPVSLSSARTDLFNNGIKVRHFFDLKGQKTDSSEIDAGKSIVRIVLDHQYGFKKYTFNENNPENSYYTFVFDSLRTNSNYTERKFENEFALLWLNPAKDSSTSTGSSFKLFLKSQLINFSNNFGIAANDTFGLSTNNLLAGGDVSLAFSKNFILNAEGSYFFAGFNRGDAFVKGSVLIGNSNSLNFRAGVVFSRTEQSFFLQRFTGNFNRWNTSPDKQIRIHLFGNISIPKLFLNAEIHLMNIGNYAYLNSDQLPEINSNSLNLIQLSITQKRIKFKKWHLQSNIIMQFVPQNDQDIVRVPLLQFQESIFREGRIGKSTPWRIGADIIGSTGFTPMAYAPQLGNFYLQSAFASDGLLQLNPYVSVKIKRVRFFAMLEHVNAGLFGPNPILVPYYPLPDRYLKLGLSWVFFD